LLSSQSQVSVTADPVDPTGTRSHAKGVGQASAGNLPAKTALPVASSSDGTGHLTKQNNRHTIQVEYSLPCRDEQRESHTGIVRRLDIPTRPFEEGPEINDPSMAIQGSTPIKALDVNSACLQTLPVIDSGDRSVDGRPYGENQTSGVPSVLASKIADTKPAAPPMIVLPAGMLDSSAQNTPCTRNTDEHVTAAVAHDPTRPLPHSAQTEHTPKGTSISPSPLGTCFMILRSLQTHTRR
jgi:hypothetical protein